jgi:hypothetical protein
MITPDFVKENSQIDIPLVGLGGNDLGQVQWKEQDQHLGLGYLKGLVANARGVDKRGIELLVRGEKISSREDEDKITESLRHGAPITVVPVSRTGLRGSVRPKAVVLGGSDLNTLGAPNVKDVLGSVLDRGGKVSMTVTHANGKQEEIILDPMVFQAMMEGESAGLETDDSSSSSSVKRKKKNDIPLLYSEDMSIEEKKAFHEHQDELKAAMKEKQRVKSENISTERKLAQLRQQRMMRKRKSQNLKRRRQETASDQTRKAKQQYPTPTTLSCSLPNSSRSTTTDSTTTQSTEKKPQLQKQNSSSSRFAGFKKGFLL